MEIAAYEDMSIELMQATEHPSVLTGLALNLTMRQDASIVPVTPDKCGYLIDAEHMSPFEHVHFSFLIQGISRSLLAQITRQRTANITSGSQHYQDYSEYPCIVSKTILNNYSSMKPSLERSVEAYRHLVTSGVPREEARQVLPNAAAVHILWTIDARNLFYFLRQRLCNRNVMEMRVFASNILVLAIDTFPELFQYAGPQCFRGSCKQGKMRCTAGQWERI